MTVTLHEQLIPKEDDEKITFAQDAEKQAIIRTTLGAVCIPLPDTRSSLGVLQVKRQLELGMKVDTTLTLHRVFPGDPEAPHYTPADKMVAVFTPTSDEEAAVRNQAVAELQERYPERTFPDYYTEMYGSHIFRGPKGPSEAGIPEDKDSPLMSRFEEIASLLTQQSVEFAA